ncbi:MAG: DUF4097 family beta strand repeat-containing protein [Gemmatimonadota bacterium]
MKQTIFCLVMLFALCANAALAQRKLDERRAIVPDGFVRIFMPGGSVTVVGWDRDSLHVTGTVHETAGDRFALGVTPKGAKLGMWSEFESALPPSHITVRVPRRSQVWVKTTGAAVRVSGVDGGLDVLSVSGSIEVDGAPREIYAETMGGDIAIDATTPAARLKTASSAIRVRGSIADLTALTVSGPIELAAVSYRRARLESVAGDISYTGALPPGSALEITNHAGAVDLLLPANVAAQFALSLYAGELIGEFGAVAKLRNPKQKARELSFVLGDKPAASVTVRSFKGRVAVRKLAAAP